MTQNIILQTLVLFGVYKVKASCDYGYGITSGINGTAVGGSVASERKTAHNHISTCNIFFSQVVGFAESLSIACSGTDYGYSISPLKQRNIAAAMYQSRTIVTYIFESMWEIRIMAAYRNNTKFLLPVK